MDLEAGGETMQVVWAVAGRPMEEDGTEMVHRLQAVHAVVGTQQYCQVLEQPAIKHLKWPIANSQVRETMSALEARQQRLTSAQPKPMLVSPYRRH